MTPNVGPRIAALLLGALSLAGEALAQSALVHIQGDVGRREAYFANFSVVLDRTPVDQILGPTSVRQLETTIVYESPDKPEFGALRLQFECTVKYAYDGKNIPKQPPHDAPIRLRIGEGSWKLRREDLKSEDLPAGEWRTSSSPVLSKLHKIACNEDVMRSAIIQAAKKNNDVRIFQAAIRTVGLPDDLQLVPQQSPAEYLEFAWSVLWSGSPRPDPSGKWSRRSTRQELEEARAKIAKIQQQYDQLAGEIRPKLERNLEQLDAKLAFQKTAADLRKGRRLSRNETLMLSVWEGRTETDVAVAMGAPIVTDAGALRFMSYGQEYDNRVVVANGKGAVWEEGLYENCNVQFVLHPDSAKVLRVADVKIWTSSNRIAQVTFACDGLLETPR